MGQALQAAIQRNVSVLSTRCPPSVDGVDVSEPARAGRQFCYDPTSGAASALLPRVMGMAGERPDGRDRMASRVLKTVLVALAAVVAGYLAALGIGLVAFDVFQVSQREGAAAMGLAFVIGPAVAIICALVAGLWYWIFSGRRNLQARAPRGSAARLGWAFAAALGGWLAGLLLQWMLQGRSYETFVVALTVSLAPWFGALGFAAATWLLLRRRES